MNTLTLPVVDQRVRDAAIEHYWSLLRQAYAAGLTIEPDTIHLDTWIVRCPDEPGLIELTTLNACGCRRFRVWRRSPCHTLVNHLTVSYGLERAA